ncbi:Protein IQ-DOMAIN 1 [Senna tora]|uniref:Protein IQ-DOMAIN 1 n=1 Tax=Senna tora TaxID=362788 RepID=A0A834TIZ0_9FABA|nr:Protein IQ-DOMAIN 1 [Senna tora]
MRKRQQKLGDLEFERGRDEVGVGGASVRKSPLPLFEFDSELDVEEQRTSLKIEQNLCDRGDPEGNEIGEEEVSIVGNLVLLPLWTMRLCPNKWFKTIVKRKKHKENKSKQQEELVQPNGEKSEEWKQNSNEESSSIPNEALMVNRAVPTRLIQDIAATRIQNAFRSFMARRTTIEHLRGTEKFEALIQDHLAREQTATALSYIHSWCSIQDQIRARRLCMVTEARIKQKKLENQLKLEAKLHELEVEWCSGSETMEEILSRIHQREEAAVKRERAMAYAFSHQWRPNCSQYFGQASFSLGKESWGWSWMERWVAARPWEIRVRVQSPKAKKPNGPNQTKSDKVPSTTNQTDSSKTTMSNGKEAGKAKENNTSGLSKNNLP